MKRTVNNVPLEALTGLMSGFTKIRIENRRECNVFCDGAADTEVWEGIVKDLHDFKKCPDIVRYKWMMTKVREVRHTPEGITFIISTEFEQY